MPVQLRDSTVKVLGIGDVVVDLSIQATQLPPRGGNIWCPAVQLSPGGTSANVAANLARLGIGSAFVGCVGDDSYGHYVIEEFEKAGVDTGGIIIRPDAFTGLVLTIIDEGRERTFIACMKGAAQSQLHAKDIERLDFKSAPVIHSSGVCLVEEPSRTALLMALTQAQQAGCRIFYDPNLRLEGNVFLPELRSAQFDAISQSTVVLIGDEELQLLCGGESPEQCVEVLRRIGPELVVVKQGEKGATLYHAEGREVCPAFKVPVASLAGAGDAFDAGFIAACERKASLPDALRYACAVAALKVTRHGGRSVADHAEVITFLAKHGQTLS